MTDTITTVEGRRYRLVSCALRNSGQGWGIIADAGHQPAGALSVVERADHLELQHPVAAVTVSSLQVTPDETFAAAGLRAGASVGLNLSRIYLYDEPADHITDQVYYDGSRWVSETGVYSITADGAVLTLTHESMGAGGSIAIGNRGGLLIQAGVCTPTTTKAALYRGAYGELVGVTTPTTGARAYITRYGRRAVPPARPAGVISPGGNLWITALLEA
ncbi:hypothetical protein EES45_22870 [Streptomyces sp. ADI97-07]|uniref:hypothetical protein n=1 Tax=Streptomyces sp. ADI97-07 TaxID=1522762 RepID=UPI000F5595AB|nr:hypothetical protein [Streptomyces sp. ADI97-07]RPK76605.1 hypothetical protein EES45_22870 [Streptomyces sp. ADI97-07]